MLKSMNFLKDILRIAVISDLKQTKININI